KEERAYYGLAIIYEDEGNYEKALENYKKAIGLNPYYHKAYFF
ncbi:MAG: tetratricopeptide repeat protein, partial [Clostridium cochlearium]|nr:tetratricopeptide repeat protein [Clostridium cochlearium]